MKFSEILSKIPDLLITHRLFKRDLGVVSDGEWSYVYRSEEDEARLIHLRVFLFNIYHKKYFFQPIAQADPESFRGRLAFL